MERSHVNRQEYEEAKTNSSGWSFLAMRTAEAVNMFKEISANCASLKPYVIALTPPNANSVLSKGYQLHIFAQAGQGGISCLKSTLENSNLHLEILQEENKLVIYKP